MDGRDILVVGELRGGEPSPWTLQLVSGARALAESAGGSVAVLIAECDTDELARHGAGRVTTIAGASEGSPVEPVVAAASSLLGEGGAALALFPDSVAGRDAASQVTARLDVPLLSACERLSIDGDGALEALRSCFGGQVSAAVAFGGGPCVATVCEHTFRASRSESAPAVETNSITPQVDENVTVLETRAPDPESLDLEEAEVLVSGGLGVGGPEGFELLQRLAAVLRGTTAASRVAVDRGWVPQTKQVGQTGRTVAPKLYFACGISGAREHMVGMRDAGTLVALNLDERAPIMREADLAAVGDVAEVLPLLLRELSGNGGAS